MVLFGFCYFEIGYYLLFVFCYLLFTFCYLFFVFCYLVLKKKSRNHNAYYTMLVPAFGLLFY
jgi:hypothetical protein